MYAYGFKVSLPLFKASNTSVSGIWPPGWQQSTAFEIWLRFPKCRWQFKILWRLLRWRWSIGYYGQLAPEAVSRQRKRSSAIFSPFKAMQFFSEASNLYGYHTKTENISPLPVHSMKSCGLQLSCILTGRHRKMCKETAWIQWWARQRGTHSLPLMSKGSYPPVLLRFSVVIGRLLSLSGMPSGAWIWQNRYCISSLAPIEWTKEQLMDWCINFSHHCTHPREGCQIFSIDHKVQLILSHSWAHWLLKRGQKHSYH